MCTALTFSNGDFYFGRNMDIAHSFGEQVVITPRRFPIQTKRLPTINQHYAMIGMANVTNGTPLYAEAISETGLCMAGLFFSENASYQTDEEIKGKPLAPYELIPYLLGCCANVDEVKRMLSDISVIAVPFCEELPLAPLHWIVADETSCIVLEPSNGRLSVYDNPYGVLTNNPPFPFHRENIRQYLHLSAAFPENQFDEHLALSPFGEGMGAIGIPGDASPASRFVKALFCKCNSVCDQTESACVSQVFHILDAVAMVRGCVRTKRKEFDLTTYSCCVNVSKGIYYYKTYENNQITAVSMVSHVNETNLCTYKLRGEQQIYWEA
ncbi:choloylglycine hydrolase family protein [Phocea massiliensis]|uniref:choloylglycine hydrolase n=1 Tax=Merdimmobilis hominis TaxID=2897707 RepID=A0A938X5X0_9FIRM|nr:choloylglycine hydrolase [Merdimmobilis hominis]MBM6919776.1 choloylglycine hydrolase family protein [Merdimmobilis hominis]